MPNHVTNIIRADAIDDWYDPFDLLDQVKVKLEEAQER